MNRCVVSAACVLVLAAPAHAQHAGHGTPPATATKTPEPAPDMPANGHSPLHATDPLPAGGEFLAPPEPGNDIPPDPPADHAADALYPRAAMERARAVLEEEHGGALISQVMANELEYTGSDGGHGYRWHIEAWYGGDLNRAVFRTKAEGAGALETAEVQALYSRAVGPYADLQVGLRYDIEPHPNRTYLTIGAQALLPYWFEAEGALFVGEGGQLLGRLEGSYDLMLTQLLVLQPNAEVNLALRDDAAVSLGSGFSSAEVGLRLRYEFSREFAPYIGILWERKFGRTADLARLAGEDPEATRFVGGLRAWF